MIKTDKERIAVFRRITGDKFDDMYDNEVLEILNSAVLPNSLSKDAIKYTLLSGMIFYKNDTQKSIDKMSRLYSAMSKLERDLFKFGVYHGFDSANPSFQYHRFIHSSLDPFKKNLAVKKISSAIFERVFYFVYNLIKKGEQNERFPRI